MDISAALVALAPEAEWSLNAENYDQLEWFSTDIPKPTLAEVNAKVAELEAAEPMRLLRKERDRLIAETDWVTMRAYSTKTDVPTEWAEYQQALRDLPDNSTPVLDNTTRLGISGVDWPTKPS